jgi:hypothetical protein
MGIVRHSILEISASPRRAGDLEMNPPDGQDDDAGTARRVLAIDLEELCWALNARDPLGQGSHWLNLESGELLFLVGPDALSEDDEDPREDERWLRVEAIDSSDAFRIMEDFVDQCENPRLARTLSQALQQRKPFRRFKDALAAHPAQREAWFAFERQAMEAVARRWCEDKGITPTWVTRRQPPSS